MRRLVIKLILFCAVIEGLGHVDITVLLAATGVALASEGEHFHALRDARQKFSILAAREIMQAMKPNL